MKKSFFISIKTKLFLILSALMALILAVQFFMAYQAQQDLLKELNYLSQNINMAIDSHYLNVLKDIQQEAEIGYETFKIKDDSFAFSRGYETFPESLYVQVITELKNLKIV
ncbi:MAG: hypothetical protein JSW33_16800 [bacterium]|nr:MAG: hypothetical protein JSW33_16800 [bacterium]